MAKHSSAPVSHSEAPPAPAAIAAPAAQAAKVDKLAQSRADKAARQKAKAELRLAPLGFKMATPVPCPDCGMPMYACTDVVKSFKANLKCPLCPRDMAVVSEDGDRRVLRCPTPRHRVPMKEDERRRQYLAAIKGKDPENPADAFDIQTAQAKFIEEPLRDSLHRVLVEDPQEKVQEADFQQRLKCPNPGCRFFRKMEEHLEKGEKVEVDAGMQHHVHLVRVGGGGWAIKPQVQL